MSSARFQVAELELPGIKLITPRVHRDERGFFVERWHSAELDSLLGTDGFKQDNHSRSRLGALRGLHYQNPPAAQGKLVGVTRGRIYDVVVDVRPSSPTYRRWVGVVLDESTPQLLWVPRGFAHGFLALAEDTDVLYKVDAHHDAAAEAGIRFDDETLGIDWEHHLRTIGVTRPLVSARDAAMPRLEDAENRFS
ncbi:MAG: dTDP-4-dehydrorhamnose 3,5-epimerase [Trueperaceae bacterium]|nr:dTDP-4-dehydrorhamnose 3,5-epimerase [Trueperaceae bacterium]